MTGRVFDPIMAVHLPGETLYPPQRVPAAFPRVPRVPLTRLSGIPYRKPSKYKKYVGIASTCTGGWGVPCVRGQAIIFIFVLVISLIVHPAVNSPNLPDKLPPNTPQINIAPTRTRARFVICHIKCMVYSMGMHHD